VRAGGADAVRAGALALIPCRALLQAVQTRGGQKREPCDMGAQLAGLAGAGLKPSTVAGGHLDLAHWQSWPWDVVWEV
jgi:hypothetical protein